MKPSYLIDPGTRLGPVHYITADLDKQLDFYTHSLGLRLHWKTEQGAGLGAGQEDLLNFNRGAISKTDSPNHRDVPFCPVTAQPERTGPGDRPVISTANSELPHRPCDLKNNLCR